MPLSPFAAHLSRWADFTPTLRPAGRCRRYSHPIFAEGLRWRNRRAACPRAPTSRWRRYSRWRMRNSACSLASYSRSSSPFQQPPQTDSSEPPQAICRALALVRLVRPFSSYKMAFTCKNLNFLVRFIATFKRLQFSRELWPCGHMSVLMETQAGADHARSLARTKCPLPTA